MRLEKPSEAGHSNNLIVNKGCQVVHREIALRLLNSFIISFRIEVIQRLHHY